jgi:predicted RNA-binding protein YlxR (DUF448 family)
MAKHIPQRTCVGCREVQGKRQLARVVRQADGHVRLDATGKAQGRGAYVHASWACWQSALAGGRLAHALKLDRLEEADRAELQAYAATLPKEDETAQ